MGTCDADRTPLTIYEHYVKPLTGPELERYYEEMKALGDAYSIRRETMPADFTAFRRYWDSMVAGGLRVTETTRDVADAVLRPELGPLTWPAVKLMRLVTVGTLPAMLRAELRLNWGPNRERALAGSQTAIRNLLPVFPGPIRRFPRA